MTVFVGSEFGLGLLMSAMKCDQPFCTMSTSPGSTTMIYARARQEHVSCRY